MARPTRDKRETRKAKASYSIIADGQTEKWYFERMRECESLPVKISPAIGCKNLEEQYELALLHSNHYDQIYWIIDLDVIRDVHRETKKEKSVVEELKGYYKEIKKYDNIEVIVNNPGLEIWFLMHYKNTTKCYESCAAVIHDLKRADSLSNYEKTEKYFKKANNCIYKRLKEAQATGIANAKALGDFDINEGLENSKSEIYKVVEKLLKAK